MASAEVRSAGAGDHVSEGVGWVGGAGGVGEPGVVALSASGEGDVGVVAGGAGIEDGEADVDGVALVAVAGDRPAQLDVSLRVVDRQGDAATVGMRGDQRAVAVDGGDGPGVPVADRFASVGDQLGVVASGGDLIAHTDPGAVGELEPPWVL